MLMGWVSPVSIVKGSRFAGLPVSRNRSEHFRFIHRSSFQGNVRDGFATAFAAMTRGKLHGDSDSEMTPFWRFSSMRAYIDWCLPFRLQKVAGLPISRNESGHFRFISGVPL